MVESDDAARPLAGTAALCIHGFGGAPFEMRGMARALEAAGCAVDVPLLPGHGTTPEDWDRTTFGDWAGAVEAAYDRLAGGHEKVFVCGLSLGGLLTLHLGIVRRPAAIAALAAPVFLYRWWPPLAVDWRLPLVPLLRHVRPLWRTGKPNENSRRIAPWQGYEGVTALNALHSMIQAMREVRRRLPEIQAPLLAMHNPGDTTVPFESSKAIIKEAGSKTRHLEVLPIAETTTGHHLLTTHQETKARVEALVPAFFAENILTYHIVATKE